MLTTMLVNANAIAYDIIFSNLVEKSFKFSPLKPHGTHEPWPESLCSKCKLELNQIINHMKLHNCKGSKFMGKWGSIKNSFQLHFSNKFNVEYTYKRLILNFSWHGLSPIPSSPPS
jgi:hypothetical protein